MGKIIHVAVVQFCIFLASFSPASFCQAKGVCKVKVEGELFKKKPTYKIQYVLILLILFPLPEVQGKGAELTLQIIYNYQR